MNELWKQGRRRARQALVSGIALWLPMGIPDAELCHWVNFCHIYSRCLYLAQG